MQPRNLFRKHAWIAQDLVHVFFLFSQFFVLSSRRNPKDKTCFTLFCVTCCRLALPTVQPLPFPRVFVISPLYCTSFIVRLDRESDMAALLEATRPALKDVLGKVYSMSRDQVCATSGQLAYVRLRSPKATTLIYFVSVVICSVLFRGTLSSVMQFAGDLTAHLVTLPGLPRNARMKTAKVACDVAVAAIFFLYHRS